MNCRNSARHATVAAVTAAMFMPFAPLGTGSVAQAETLQAVVQEALETHPELGAIRFNRRAIDQELVGARGMRLPTVDVQANDGRRRSVDTAANGVVTGDGWHTNGSFSGVASQRLFDGFEARSEISRQKSRVESARWRVMDTANSIALRAVQAYLEVQRARVVLVAAQRNVAAHEALLGRVSTRVQGGRGTSSDESEAQTRTHSARALRLEAQNRLDDAMALFISVTGHKPGDLPMPKLPEDALPKTIDAAVGEAIAAAPSVLATQSDVNAARFAVDGAYARYYPRLNLELSTDNATNIREVGDRSVDARAMLVVRWNLFNGGIDRARISEAKARELEAAEISANTRRIIERETRVSWNALAAARGRLPQLARQLDFARRARSTYASQFDGGQRRLLDLLNIQAETFVAESSLRTEELVRAYNVYRILASIGRLVPALGLELPPEAVTTGSASAADAPRDGRKR